MKKLKVLIITIIITCIIIISTLYIINAQKSENENVEKSKKVIEKNTEEELDYEIVNREIDTNQVAPVLSENEYFKNISYNTYFAISNCIAANTKNNIIINIKSIIVDKVNSYTVNTIEMTDNYEFVKNRFYIVNLDYANSTYSIEDVTDRYNNFEDIKVNKIENIEESGNNKYVQRDYTEEYKYKQIFQNMKSLILVKPELAYEYLDNDYKIKRFGNIKSFIDYINNNRNHLIEIIPKGYKVDENNKNKIWIRDQYSNWYEFNLTTNTMEYTAKIDNYIIMLDKDVKKYNGYEDTEKVKYNIRRWIKMLNSKDYGYAYNYLDDTFKQDNYPSENDFIQLMQSKYPDYYDLVSISTTEDGNVFTSEVQLSVNGEEFADKYMTIVMRLEEGTDFTMSFDVQ